MLEAARKRRNSGICGPNSHSECCKNCSVVRSVNPDDANLRCEQAALMSYLTRTRDLRVIGEPAHVKPRGFEDLYRNYWADLCRQVRTAFGAGPPEPEDVAQAAFERLASVQNPERIHNPRGFLLVTARNIVLDHKRRSGKHFEYARVVVAEHSDLKMDDLSPERLLIHKERFLSLRQAIEKLPHKQKVVLRLHRQQGYTYQQIADETGWSYGDVNRQVDNALASLSQALKNSASPL